MSALSKLGSACALGMLALGMTPAHGALFVGIGDLPGGPVVSATMNISGDGRVVVGGAARGTYDDCCRTYLEYESVRWTFEHGLQGLGELPDEYTGRARDVSHDGRVIVGTSNNPGTPRPPAKGFRWTEASGLQPVGGTIKGPCRGWTADAVSGDGKVVVGRSFSGDVHDYGCVTEAYAVRADNSMIRLGIRDEDSSLYRGFNESSAEAVSFDGTVIAGQSNRRPESKSRAWVWREETGIVDIGSLDGHNDVDVVTMSSNGQYIIGRSGDGEVSSDFIWSEDNGMMESPIAFTTDVSNDGMVVGHSLDEDMIWRTALWSEESGLRTLEDVMTNLSVDEQTAGWNLNDPGEAFWWFWRTSDDGDVIVGTGINPDGNSEGWVAILRESGIDGDFNEDGRLDASDISLLSVQSRLGTTNPVFNVNGDSVVDDLDRMFWVRDLANTYFGDANLDGEFNSGDLVQIFRAGQYEDAIDGNSGWADGDWNGDGDFDTSDLVVAFDDGGFELGPRPVAAVPEPSLWPMLLAGLLPVLRRRLRS